MGGKEREGEQGVQGKRREEKGGFHATARLLPPLSRMLRSTGIGIRQCEQRLGQNERGGESGGTHLIPEPSAPLCVISDSVPCTLTDPVRQESVFPGCNSQDLLGAQRLVAVGW